MKILLVCQASVYLRTWIIFLHDYCVTKLGFFFFIKHFSILLYLMLNWLGFKTIYLFFKILQLVTYWFVFLIFCFRSQTSTEIWEKIENKFHFAVQPVSQLGNWLPACLKEWKCVDHGCGLNQVLIHSNSNYQSFQIYINIFKFLFLKCNVPSA